MMFIISEIFPQHSGDEKRMEQMILQSKLAGADAVKVQLYPATMFPAPEGYSRAYIEMNYDALARAKEYADKVGIPLFATPFDMERLGWCDTLDLPYLKVAARTHRENPDLVEAILARNKTTFISIPSDMTLDGFPREERLIYFYCISKYPTRLDETTLPEFGPDGYDGLSDHGLGIAPALVACMKGARYLEKHFTLSRNLQKATELAHIGSMDAEELSQIRRLTMEIELMCRSYPGKIA